MDYAAKLKELEHICRYWRRRYEVSELPESPETQLSHYMEWQRAERDYWRTNEKLMGSIGRRLYGS